jgi:hypothetical protein
LHIWPCRGVQVLLSTPRLFWNRRHSLSCHPRLCGLPSFARASMLCCSFFPFLLLFLKMHRDWFGYLLLLACIFSCAMNQEPEWQCWQSTSKEPAHVGSVGHVTLLEEFCFFYLL